MPKIPHDWQRTFHDNPHWQGHYWCPACGNVAIDEDWDVMGLGWMPIKGRLVFMLGCLACGLAVEPVMVIPIDLPLFAAKGGEE